MMSISIDLTGLARATPVPEPGFRKEKSKSKLTNHHVVSVNPYLYVRFRKA
jgi:hypothetical protein